MLSAARGGMRSLVVGPRPDSLPPDRWLTLSLLAAVVITAWPQAHDSSLAFMVLVVTLAASIRFRIGALALIVLFIVGVDLRVAEFGRDMSDVATVIRGVIQLASANGNPYLVVTDNGMPLSPPFPYGPLALLWYAPLGDPRLQEMLVSVTLLGVLALRGRPLGLALWATAPLSVRLASDGSNDHSMALFLLVALVVLERMPRAGAALIGVAAGLKIYALAWLPPIAVWAGMSALVAAVAGALLVWLPAALLWGPGNIFRTFQVADAFHKEPYFSLGELISSYGLNKSPPRELLNMFRLVAGAVTAVAVAPFVRSHRGVVVGGMLIYAVTLYSGYWSSPAYLVPPLLIGCWYVDLWLGPSGADHSADSTRIRWPRDPVGALSRAADRKWPRLDVAKISGQ